MAAAARWTSSRVPAVIARSARAAYSGSGAVRDVRRNAGLASFWLGTESSTS